MILVADESVERGIAERLRRDGHEVRCVSEDAPGTPDDVVLAEAVEAGSVVLTEDTGFGDMVFQQGCATSGVILIRLHGLSESVKAEIVAAAVAQHASLLRGAFTVVSPGLIRIRRTL